MVKVYKQSTWLLMLLFILLFICGMMVKNTIFKIAVMIWPICGMVSSIKHRNDKILICDKGIESVFKPLHGEAKQILIPWREISHIEIIPNKTGAMLNVYGRKENYEKDISFLFPLGTVNKLKKTISDIGHVKCKIIRM